MKAVDEREALVPALRYIAGALRKGHRPPGAANLMDAAADEIVALQSDVVAFCAPWAAQYARDFGLPERTLHPTHYDILERCGARMDDFKRAPVDGTKGAGQ